MCIIPWPVFNLDILTGAALNTASDNRGGGHGVNEYYSDNNPTTQQVAHAGLCYDPPPAYSLHRPIGDPTACRRSRDIWRHGTQVGSRTDHQATGLQDQPQTNLICPVCAKVSKSVWVAKFANTTAHRFSTDTDFFRVHKKRHAYVYLRREPERTRGFIGVECQNGLFGNRASRHHCLVPECTRYERPFSHLESLKRHVRITHPDFGGRLGKTYANSIKPDDEVLGRDNQRNVDLHAKGMTRVAVDLKQGTDFASSIRLHCDQLQLGKGSATISDQLLPTERERPATQKQETTTDDLPTHTEYRNMDSIDETQFPILGMPLGSDATFFRETLKQDEVRGTIPSNRSFSTIRSDISSPDWIDDEKDRATLQVVYTSTEALLGAYAKFSLRAFAGRGSKSGRGTTGTVCSQASSQGQTSSQDDPCNRKRKLGRTNRGTGQEEYDGGDDRRQPTTSKKPLHPDRPLEPPLACPFNKYDSRLFGPGSPDESYHGCASCSFVSVAHLKQHLQRAHYVPKHHCFRCCTKFSSHGAVAAHMRSEPPCSRKDPPLYQERISIDLAEELCLERKNPQGTDKKDYWHRLYQTFFPGAANVKTVSPFYEGPAAQQLNEFLSFSRSTIPDLLVRVQQRLGHDAVSITLTDQAQLVDEVLQVAGQRYMENIAVYTFPQLGQRSVELGTHTMPPPDAASATTGPANEGLGNSTRDVSSTSTTCQDSELATVATHMTSFPSDPTEYHSSGRPPEDMAAVDEADTTDLMNFDWDHELDSMPGFDWDVFQAQNAEYLQPEYLAKKG